MLKTAWLLIPRAWLAWQDDPAERSVKAREIVGSPIACCRGDVR
jgi:hypothetical protein